jgi:hypothetical protein
MKTLLALTLSAPLLQAAPPYVAAGVVIDSQTHRPLAHARVTFAPATERTAKLEQLTKPDGRFSFTTNEPGKYTLRVNKPGYPPQAYRQSSFSTLSSAVVVRDDQDTSHIVFEARRGGAITGVIKDEDSEPVGRALVTLYQSIISGGTRRLYFRGQTRANVLGEYRIANLPAGNYYVCAMGRPWFADSVIQFQKMQDQIGEFLRVKAVGETPNAEQSVGTPQSPDDDEPRANTRPEPPQFSPDPNFRGTGFLTTFYPRARTVEEASFIQLETGGEAQASITLSFAKAVTIKGSIASSTSMSAGSAHLYQRYRSQHISFLEAPVSAEGKFEMGNIPGGSYELFAYSAASSGPSSWNVRQIIEVGPSDLDLTFRADYLGGIRGRVLFEGDHPRTGATPLVLLRNQEDTTLRIQPDAEGTFSWNNFPMGRYEVSVSSADYAAAYLADPSGRHLPLTLEINSSEPVHRDVVLTRAVSAIEGTARLGDQPYVGAFVLLLPKDSAQRDAYRLDQSDSDGSFRLAKIPTGDYTLIALTDGADVEYRDQKIAAALAQAGKPVHIESGDHPNINPDVMNPSALHLPASR